MRLLTLSLLLLLPSCSIERYAIDRLGDALSGTNTTFSSDDDPELVRQAVPFSLKLIEAVLEQSPRHEGLLLAAAGGFTQYTFAFVLQDADEAQDHSVARAAELRARARRLYLRARDYGLRGLEARHRGFTAGLQRDRVATLGAVERRDVPLLYWTAAAWAGAIDLSKAHPETVADLPVVEALLDRALALDEAFGGGAIHLLLISYEPTRPGGAREAETRARAHYARAVEFSRGQLAGPMVALAESIALPKQDRAEFESLLKAALSIDPDIRPESRLENLVMQRRARWLLDHVEDHFVE